MSTADEGLATAEVETEALVAALGTFVAAQQLVVLRRLRRSAGDGALPVLADAWDAQAWDAQLSRTIAGRSLRIGQVGADEVLDVWNVGRAGWSADVMGRWLVAASSGRARQINQATYNGLVTALTEGGAEGWERNIAEEFVRRYNQMPQVAGRQIGTEARSFGGYDAARASGLTAKTWHVAATRRHRRTHAAINGLSIPLDGMFPNGARWPGDAMAGPAETGGCTCYLTYGV